MKRFQLCRTNILYIRQTLYAAAISIIGSPLKAQNESDTLRSEAIHHQISLGDLVGAQSLYEQSCIAGNAASCNDAGDFYRGGVYVKNRGIKIDQARAAQLYRMACDGGSLSACATIERLRSKVASAQAPTGQSIRRSSTRVGRKANEWEHLLACYMSRVLIANIEYERLENSGGNVEAATPLTERAFRYRFAAIALLANEGAGGQSLLDTVNKSDRFGEKEYLGYYDPNRINEVCVDPSNNLVLKGYHIQQRLLNDLSDP